MLIPYTERWYVAVAPSRIYGYLTSVETKTEKYFKRFKRWYVAVAPSPIYGLTSDETKTETKTDKYLKCINRKLPIDLRKRVYADLLKIVLVHPGCPRISHWDLMFVLRKLLTVVSEADLLALFDSDGDLRSLFDTRLDEIQKFLINTLANWVDSDLGSALLCHVNLSAAIGDRRLIFQEALHRSAEGISTYHGGVYLSERALARYCRLYSELSKSEPEDQHLALALRPLLSAYDTKTRERGFELVMGTTPPSLQPELFRVAFEHSRGYVQAELLNKLCGLPTGRDIAVPLVKGLIRQPLEASRPFSSLDKGSHPVRNAADAALKRLVPESEALALYSEVVTTGEPIDVFEAVDVLATSYDPNMIIKEFRKVFQATDHAFTEKLLRDRLRIKDHLDSGQRVLVATLSFLPHEAVIRVFEEVGFSPDMGLTEMLQSRIVKGQIVMSESLLNYLKSHVHLESHIYLSHQNEHDLLERCRFLAQYTSFGNLVELLKKGLASSIERGPTLYFIASLHQVIDQREIEELLCHKFDMAESHQIGGWGIHSHLLAIADSGLVLKNNDLVERIKKVRSESYRFIDNLDCFDSLSDPVSNVVPADKILQRSLGLNN